MRQFVSFFTFIFAGVAKTLTKILSFLFLLPVHFYRWFISPLLPASCRHVPTCSQFAIDALKLHGPLRGTVMATGRILRCRPGGTHGYDPVPRFIFRKYRFRESLFTFSNRCNRLKERD